jgi:hypothetical protein
LFLFTFSESDSVYMVTPTSEQGLTKGNMISISFHELNRYRFFIIFHSDQYGDLEGEMFRLEATSWNDIRLTKV